VECKSSLANFVGKLQDLGFVEKKTRAKRSTTANSEP